MSRRVLTRACARVARKYRGEGGAAALEFALVAPLLFALVFGIIGYGYMLSFRQGISQGAAEGARAAAVSMETDAGVKEEDARQALNNSLEAYDVSCGSTGTLSHGGRSVGTCSVAIAACANSPSKECATVNVNYAYRDNPLIPSFPGLGVTLPQNLDYTATARVS